MRYWLGVVSADHVRRGVELGIAQIGHGQKSGLARMGAGDGLAYYSPRETLGGGGALKAFTAVGRIADDELWQADEGEFRPWRRRVEYQPVPVPVPLDLVRADLELTRAPNWGYQLRRGHLEVSRAYFDRIAEACRTGV